MKKTKNRRIRIIVMIATILLSIFVPALSNKNSQSVKAASIAVTGLDASDAVITDKDGNVVTNASSLNSATDYRASYNWSIADGVAISAGDTIAFTLPNNVTPNYDTTFELTNTSGQVVGTVSIKAGEQTGTITFSDVLASANYDRSGSIYITVHGKSSTNTGTNPWFVNKIGWLDGPTMAANDGKPQEVVWDIAVNPQGNSADNVILTDVLGANQTYKPGSVEVTTGYYDSANQWFSTGSSTAAVSVSGQTITINLGNITTALNVVFHVTIQNLSLTGENVWNNKVGINTDGGTNLSKEVSSSVTWGGGGTGSGYSGSANLTKVDRDTGLPVAGAIFSLAKDGVVITTGLTTDSNGLILVNNLAAGNYQFIETAAPEGYRLPVTVDGLKFTIIAGENITQQIRATNTAITSVSGTKTWLDDNNSGHTRPKSITIMLAKNGVVVASQQVTAATGWHYLFSDLDKYDSTGKPITYSTSEKAVAGYTTSQEGNNFTNTLVAKPKIPSVPSNPGTPTKPKQPNKPVKKVQHKLPQTSESSSRLLTWAGMATLIFACTEWYLWRKRDFE